MDLDDDKKEVPDWMARVRANDAQPAYKVDMIAPPVAGERHRSFDDEAELPVEVAQTRSLDLDKLGHSDILIFEEGRFRPWRGH